MRRVSQDILNSAAKNENIACTFRLDSAGLQGCAAASPRRGPILFGRQPCCNVQSRYSQFNGRRPTKFLFLTTYSQLKSRSRSLNFSQLYSHFKRQSDTVQSFETRGRCSGQQGANPTYAESPFRQLAAFADRHRPRSGAGLRRRNPPAPCQRFRRASGPGLPVGRLQPRRSDARPRW